jgi:hypothetical protein
VFFEYDTCLERYLLDFKADTTKNCIRFFYGGSLKLDCAPNPLKGAKDKELIFSPL